MILQTGLPSIQKTLRAHTFVGLIFQGNARNCRNRLHEATLGELFLGRLYNFVVSLCLLSVSVACFKDSICAMAILPLCQNISEE